MTLYNLFPTTPTGTYAISEQALTLGTEFTVNTACWVTQLRWFRPPNAGTGVRRGAIYSVNTAGTAGTLVYGPVDLPQGTDGAWVAQDIPALALAPGTYRVAVFHPGLGLYYAEQNYFTTGAGKTNTVRGPVTVPSNANARNKAQGSYVYSTALAFPSNAATSLYFADVTISDVNPTPAATTVKIRRRTTTTTWSANQTAVPKVRTASGWRTVRPKRRTATGWTLLP